MMRVAVPAYPQLDGFLKAFFPLEMPLAYDSVVLCFIPKSTDQSFIRHYPKSGSSSHPETHKRSQ
jgi:hypothetical protein